MTLKSCILFFTIVFVGISLAHWSNNPRVNTPICTSPGDQRYPQLVTDGHGGAIIVWSDSRGLDEDIYAQDVNAEGDIQWTYNGVPVCVSSGRQYAFDVAYYAAGGAIVAWINEDNEHVYAQFISPFGSLLWRPAGIRTYYTDTRPSILKTNELDNIIVAFLDNTGCCWGWKLHVYKLSPYDSIDWHSWASWSGPRDYTMQNIEAGGRDAFILFSKTDVQAMKISEDGSWLWSRHRVNINYRVHGDQEYATGVYNGHGKIIVAWQDNRDGDWDIYAAWIASDHGAVYPSNGMPICAARNNQIYPVLVSDGDRGAILVWMDGRNGNWDIYAQRITPTPHGLDTMWALNGIPITDKIQDEIDFAAVSDNAGGAIIVWKDVFENNIYAQRITGSGVKLWRTGGVPITLSEHASFPSIVGDDSCGAIIAWQDTRDGDANIYAQRILFDGSLGGGLSEGRLVYTGPVTINGYETCVQHELDGKISPGDHVYLRLPMTNDGPDTVYNPRVNIFSGESSPFQPKLYFSKSGSSGPYNSEIVFSTFHSIPPGSTIYVGFWVYVSRPDYDKFGYPLPYDPTFFIASGTEVRSLNLHLSEVHFDVARYPELQYNDCLRHPTNLTIRRYAQYAVANDSIFNIYRDPDIDSVAIHNLIKSIRRDFGFGIGGPRKTDIELLHRYSLWIGVCRHFTDLSCGLLRSLGFPTRDVFSRFKKRGFLGRWKLIDAHTWNEVYIPTKGRWIQFDASFGFIDKKCGYKDERNMYFAYPVIASKVPLASSYSGNLSGMEPHRLLYCPCCFGLSDCNVCMLLTVATTQELFGLYSCGIDTFFRYSIDISSDYACGYMSHYTIETNYLRDGVSIKLLSPNYVEIGGRFTASVIVVNRSSVTFRNLYVDISPHFDIGDTLNYFSVYPDTGYFLSRLNPGDSLNLTFSVDPLIEARNIIFAANIYDTSFSLCNTDYKFITIGALGMRPQLLCIGLTNKLEYEPGDTINLRAIVRDTTMRIVTDADVNATIMCIADSSIYVSIPLTVIDSVYHGSYILPDTSSIGEYSVYFVATKMGYTDGNYYSYFQVLPKLNITVRINSPYDGVSFHSDEWISISASVSYGAEFVDSAFVTAQIVYRDDTAFIPLNYTIPDSEYMLHFKPKDFIGTFGASCTSGAVWNIEVIARYAGASDTARIIHLPVRVKESRRSDIPSNLVIKHCYPNPFNSNITIEYSLPISEKVRIEIFDIAGRLISLLYNDYILKGNHKVVWYSDKNPSGIYFVRITSNNCVATRKIVLIK